VLGIFAKEREGALFATRQTTMTMDAIPMRMGAEGTIRPCG